MKFQIEELKKSEIPQLEKLLEVIIKDSFVWEKFNGKGMAKVYEDVIKMQRDRLEEYKKNNIPYFLVAKIDGEMVGTAAYAPAGDSVIKVLKRKKLRDQGLVEIIASYIKTDKQRLGIGSKLFEALLKKIKKDKYTAFSISTGYKKGMLFWEKKLGKPDAKLKRYYGPIDCWVWVRPV